MSLKTENFTITDKAGTNVAVPILVCDVCGGNAFHLFMWSATAHLQCCNPFCREMYSPAGLDFGVSTPIPQFRPLAIDEEETKTCGYCGCGISNETGDCQKCGL